MDERGRTPDLEHIDDGPDRDDLFGDVGTGRPDFAADPHPAVLRIHKLQDLGALPHQRRNPAPGAAGHAPGAAGHAPAVPAQRRKQDGDRYTTGDRKRGSLSCAAYPERRRRCRRDGGDRQQPGDEGEAEHLDTAQDSGDDHPDQPGRHLVTPALWPGRCRSLADTAGALVRMFEDCLPWGPPGAWG